MINYAEVDYEDPLITMTILPLTMRREFTHILSPLGSVYMAGMMLIFNDYSLIVDAPFVTAGPVFSYKFRYTVGF